jgi:hypothetical protein
VDEMLINLVPVLLGAGERLFEGVASDREGDPPQGGAHVVAALARPPYPPYH